MYTKVEQECMSRASDPGSTDVPLGECPDCQTTIPRENLFIRYIPRNDWPRIIAECPSCDAAVSPE